MPSAGARARNHYAPHALARPAPPAPSRGRAVAARLQYRARVVARAAAARVALRLEHVAAEHARGLGGGHVEKPLRLRIQEADPALLVDRVNAFDDAAENRLGFGLAAPQLARETDEVAAHLVHRVAEHRELLAAAHGNRGGQVARPKPSRGLGQPFYGADPIAANQYAARAGHRAMTNATSNIVRVPPLTGARTSPAGSNAWSSAIVSPVAAATGKLAA